MEAHTTPDYGIEPDLAVSPPWVVSNGDTGTDSAGQPAKADGEVVEASADPGTAESEVNNPKDDAPRDPPDKEARKIKFPKFSEQAAPSQPLLEPVVRRGSDEMKTSEQESQTAARNEPGVAESVSVTAEAVLVPSEHDEANRLHRELVGHSRTTLQTAFRLGELLAKKKASVKSRTWVNWVEDKLEFDIRSAQNYLRLYKNQALLIEKCEAVSHLGIRGALRLLSKETKNVATSTVPDESQTVVFNEAEPESVEYDQVDAATEADSDEHSPADTDTPPVEKETVAELTAEQSEQVLDLLGEFIDEDVWDSLVEHGGLIRLTATVPEEITPNLDDESVEAGTPLEVSNA
jgi:hypothetical protein